MNKKAMITKLDKAFDLVNEVKKAMRSEDSISSKTYDTTVDVETKLTVVLNNLEK